MNILGCAVRQMKYKKYGQPQIADRYFLKDNIGCLNVNSFEETIKNNDHSQKKYLDSNA